MSGFSQFKYWLRLQGISRLSWLWNGLGGSPMTLARHPRFGSELLIGQSGRIRKSVPQRSERPLKVVCFTMLGSHSYMVATELALARALRARGHEVSLVLCDRALPVCENKGTKTAGRWDEACHKCFLHGRAQFDASGLPYQWVTELAGEARDAEADALLAGLDFTHIIGSSLYKYFRIGRLQDTDEERATAARFAEACQVSARAALACARQKPDRVLMSHGVYATWAPAVMVFQKFSIPVAVYNKGKRRNSTVMNWAGGSPGWDLSREWERVKDQPLTPAQESRLACYVESRVTHAADARRYNFGDLESLEATWARFGLDPGKRTFVLFTNVLWDAASAQKEIAFPNAVDWVMETIAWFATHPELQLVVKIHPAEVVIGTRQPFASEIRARFPQLPANVRVIEPQEKVNSWSIMRIATAGLVHTSTPGLELALEGIPCLVVSHTHYRGKGFTVDIHSREDYFRTMEQWDTAKVDPQRLRTLARRYAYVLFERFHLPWDFLFEVQNGLYTAFAFRSDTELLAHPSVAAVCHALEQESDFLLPSNA